MPVLHYYKGEVVGEHRRYNENLTMFILRYRDPVTYARSWDRRDVVRGHPEAEAERLAIGIGIDNIIGDHSRKFCERNHAREAAAAEEAWKIQKLNAEREAAYQEYTRLENLAKAAAKAAADAPEAKEIAAKAAADAAAAEAAYEAEY